MRAKFLAITTTLALTMGAASTASAAPANDGDADSAARTGGDDGGTTVYDFDDDNVDGEILSPDGANVNSRARVKHASLITIRPHFISELISLSFDI